MRYFWALLAYVTAIVLTAASCGGTGKGSGFNNSGGDTATGGAGTGNANGSTGGGGSTGVGITFSDAGPASDGGCAGYKGDCAAQKLNCGMAVDGCGNTLNCGNCTAPETCAGGGTANVCGSPPCNKQTCMSLGYNCGMTTDGCGNPLDCGTCTSPDICGANNKANVCGTGGTCVPTTCAMLNATCGSVGNGCGTLLDCGTCAANQSCTNGACVSNCVPKTTCPAGLNCGVVTDGCNGVINCGSCSGNQTCGANTPNVCGTSATCTGLCLQQTTCSGTATTSISGTVYAPNGTDPLPNTLVYVPNGGPAPTYGVTAFTAGVSCGSCGSDVSGSPLVSAVTGYDGTFTITNMPVGTNIPLVIQNGRWRRQFTIPTVASCVNTALPTSGTSQIRMPRTDKVHTGGEGDIPLMAFVTGSVDALECVLRKIGIADTEFSNPSGTGRVRFYQGDGSPGAVYNNATPIEDTLWGSQATINQYDMVYFACQGDEYDKTPAAGYPNAQSIVVNYANAGGRIFATHYSYVWLFDDAWSVTANWDVDQIPNFSNDPENGTIVTSFPKGLELAQWLKFIGATPTQGTIQLNTLRNDFDGVIAPSQLWIYITDPDYSSPVPMHYTFDTPVGVPAANQCGRVLYDDFHVEDASTEFTTFPKECTVTGMSPQEKMLEFMIFDLGSCVTPPVCTPKTCASQGAMCGEVGNGCDSTTILQCGTCPSGQTCVGGVCAGNGCVPKTCTEEGFNCGMQGDGCGNAINCGTCPSGQTCGAGGKAGVCGSGSCTPTTCTAEGVMCGSIGDGCGNLINCGTCPQGEICGGGVNPKPGICGMNSCVPKTCVQQNFNCGAASDGCGNIIQCGTCSGVQTCGGSGSPNVCGGGA
jgi:hypothetical protein